MPQGAGRYPIRLPVPLVLSPLVSTSLAPFFLQARVLSAEFGRSEPGFIIRSVFFFFFKERKQKTASHDCTTLYLLDLHGLTCLMTHGVGEARSAAILTLHRGQLSNAFSSQKTHHSPKEHAAL